MTVSPFREPHDFYPTPPAGTRALLAVETFQGSIWEPACGNGAMAKVLAKAGYRVVGTDLIDRGYGTGGINFLEQHTSRGRNIITNPPYGRGLADAFVLHALALTRQTGGAVAMLLDLSCLAHPQRHPLFVRHPPASIYVLDELICEPGGRPVFTSAKTRFCWMVWRPGHQGRAALWWLSTARYR